MGLSMHSHHSAIRHLPTDGWGFAWTGDADQGSGRTQPGNWLFNILPYIEQNATYDMGSGLIGTAKLDAHRDRMGMPLPHINCPSRRPAAAVKYPSGALSFINASRPEKVTRSDYAANGGDVEVSPSKPELPKWISGPPNNDAGPASLTAGKSQLAMQTFKEKEYAANGLFFPGSVLSFKSVTDGTSKTLLIGEKMVSRKSKYTLHSGVRGDNEAALIGSNGDNTRWTGFSPASDYDENPENSGIVFGSAHPGIFGTVFCDGSTRFLSNGIGPEVFRSIGHRSDGYPVGSIE